MHESGSKISPRTSATSSSKRGGRAGKLFGSGSDHSVSDELNSSIAHLQDPMELAIFAKLRADKVSDEAEVGEDYQWSFTAESVFSTLQWAHEKQIENHTPKNKLIESLVEIWKNYGKQVACCMLVLSFVVIWAAIAVTQQLTQQVVPHPSGVLVGTQYTVANGRPIAMGTAVEFHPILEFPALPFATLRRLEQVAFWHQDAYHWYSIASVRRLGNSVTVTAKERTVLRINGPMVYVHKPCCGEQLVDSLSLMPSTSESQINASALPGRSRRTAATDAATSSDWASYGMFSVLSQVPKAKE